MEIFIAEEKDYESITNLYYDLYLDKKNNIKYFDGVHFESRIFMAKADNKSVGFIITTCVYYSASKVGYIEELFVSDGFRNAGIGQKLVEKAIDWQKSINSEVVFVTTDEAQEFYKKFGFRELRKNSWLCLPLV
ncbi:MAG: GNAT family N-acetyltransferase [Candidatus Parvarchaeum sp.]